MTHQEFPGDPLCTCTHRKTAHSCGAANVCCDCNCQRFQSSQSDLLEQLAAIEHERWADWQKYMHSLCVTNPDGSLTIPQSSVAHWERQIATPYSELSEREKASDREQVQRYFHLIAPRETAAIIRGRELIGELMDKLKDPELGVLVRHYCEKEINDLFAAVERCSSS